eukprot:COSAG01_NODE_397_length_17560_cov_111.258347_1_plen_107_part_10
MGLGAGDDAINAHLGAIAEAGRQRFALSQARADARDDGDHLGAIADAGMQRAALSQARADARGNDDHLEAIKQGATVRSFSALMGEIESGDGSGLQSVETVDKSSPV